MQYYIVLLLVPTSIFLEDLSEGSLGLLDSRTMKLPQPSTGHPER